MNYIYDTYINFQNTYFDFFEWNKEDKIIHIKKIPSFKITTKTLLNMKNDKIEIDKNFLNKIQNKTETFKKTNIEFAAIFSDGKDVIAIKFTNNGINKQKSSIRIDEQEELINIIKRKKETLINYKILNKNIKVVFQTRLEKTNKNKILNMINSLYENKETQKIKYLYLECFGKNETNINKATKEIKKEIIKTNDNFYKITMILNMIT